MQTNAGNLKKGNFIYYQDEIWQVQKADFYSPGKGLALMKTRLKNIVSGKNIEFTFKSNEEVETLDVESIEMQYLYKDNQCLFFMDERSYNQYKIPIQVVGKVADFIKEGSKCYIYIHNEKPLNIKPPVSVKLKVINAEEAVKGDTVSGAKKSAKLETGVMIMVPLFVKVGEIVIVNPETGEYTGRE